MLASHAARRVPDLRGHRLSRDPWTVLASGFLFPIHEQLKHHSSTSLRRGLERTQWLQPAELASLQEERLRAFLVRVGASVPYYRHLFAERGFDPSKGRAREMLARFPLLTKDLIRAHAGEMKAPGARLLPMSTGGSTGAPLQFYLSAERISHDVAAKWRATRWWGLDIGDPEVVLWGSPIELGRQDRLRAIRDRLLRSTLLPAFEMSDDRVRSYLATIRARRPRMLFGYPSALAHIARHAASEGRRMDDLGVRVAFVTGEVLLPEQRDRIERVFGCRVANGYGGRDAGFLAHDCPDGGMHISAEDVVIEILDPLGQPVPPGDPGEIVVTHLATADFPFLRYRTGDVGALHLEACRCGRGLPQLKEIRGRSTDLIVASDGTVMHALALIYVLREIPGIEEFKIIQEERRRVRVLVVPPAPPAPGLHERIVEGLQRRLGADVRIEVEPVDAIPVDPSGKYRYVVSRVALPGP